MRPPLLLLTLASLGPALAQAQIQRPTGKFSLGAQAGLVAYSLPHKVTRSTTYGKLGLGGGIMARWQLTDKLAVQPAILLTQQGTSYQRATGKSYSRDDETGSISLTYLNLPVLLKFEFSPGWNVQVGPQLGLLLKGHEVGPPGYYVDQQGQVRGLFRGDDDVTANYAHDVSLVVGFGYEWPQGLSFTARGVLGLRNINRDDWEDELNAQLGNGPYALHNRGLELTVGYFFIRPAKAEVLN